MNPGFTGWSFGDASKKHAAFYVGLPISFLFGSTE